MKKEKLHLIAHFIMGCVFLFKGYDKFSHHNLIGGIIFFFGIVTLAYFFFSLTRKRKLETLTNLVHWFEALASLFTAYIFYTEGKTYILYVFLLAALIFFIAIYISHANKKKLLTNKH